MKTRSLSVLVLAPALAALVMVGIHLTASAGTPKPDDAPGAPTKPQRIHSSATPSQRDVVVALQGEPNSLYVYAAQGGPYSWSIPVFDAYNATRALMDGPITSLDYDYQSVILTKIPRMEDGDVVFQSATVVSGTAVWDSNGSQVITYTGANTVMPQTVVTFTLRDGIRWSNGLSLTAQDAMFGQQVACHPDTPTDKTVSCNSIVSYQSPAPLVVRVMGLPNFTLRPQQYPANWFFDPLPYQVLSTTTPLQLVNGAYGRNPLGWGPFRLAEWVAGDHITLERNPYYWRAGYPRLDHVIFRWYNSAAALRNAVLRGDVQVVSANAAARFFSPSDLQTLAAEADASFLSDFSSAWEHLELNLDPENGQYPFLADKRVRQAVAYGLDRQQMIDSAYGGWGRVAHAYVAPENPAYTSTLRTYPYSPTLAANLLTAAGWVDTNGDGIREKLGQSFVITYSTTDSSSRKIIGGILKQNLAAVGISVTLNFTYSSVYFGGNGPLQRRTFDLAEFTWVSGLEPGCDLYLSTSVPSSSNGWSGQNYSGYNNPAYDALCLSAGQAITRDRSLALYQQTVVSISEDLPVIPLFNYLQQSMFAERSINPAPGLNPAQWYELWNIWAWDTATRVVVTPSEPLVMTGSGGAVTAIFRASTFSETTVITETPQLPLPINGDLNGIGLFYDLSAASQATGQRIQSIVPYTVTLSYTDAKVRAAAVGESTLALYWWDGAQWIKEPSSMVDIVANTVTANPNHLSLFAVLGETHRVFLPIAVRQ